jgi:hypothetical protein
MEKSNNNNSNSGKEKKGNCIFIKQRLEKKKPHPYPLEGDF